MIHRPELALANTPGCARRIKGVLVGARGHEKFVRLVEDDPMDTVGWNKAGQVGHWSRSAITERK